MNFLKQHRKNLKKLTKKQLIEQIINHIEITTNIESQFNDSYEELFQESLQHKKEKESLEWYLKSAESAIKYYENMSVWGFIRNKFR